MGVRVASHMLAERSRPSAPARAAVPAQSPAQSQATPSPPSALKVPADFASPTAAPVATIGGNVPGTKVRSVADGSRRAVEKTRAAGRASRRFGEAVWGPLLHVSGVLWLEVTGLLFGLFALFFAQSVYRLRFAYSGGQEHNKFLLYAAATAVFVYFTVSSFYRAHRKGKYAKH